MADVDTTDSEFEEVNNDRDEVNSLIDDSFEDDNNPLIYYQLQNVSRNAEEITDFLNNENETVTDEILSRIFFRWWK